MFGEVVDLCRLHLKLTKNLGPSHTARDQYYFAPGGEVREVREKEDEAPKTHRRGKTT